MTHKHTMQAWSLETPDEIQERLANFKCASEEHDYCLVPDHRRMPLHYVGRHSRHPAYRFIAQ